MHVFHSYWRVFLGPHAGRKTGGWRPDKGTRTRLLVWAVALQLLEAGGRRPGQPTGWRYRETGNRRPEESYISSLSLFLFPLAYG